MEKCASPICRGEVERLVNVTHVGKCTLIKASEKRNDGFKVQLMEGAVKVHEKCRKNYIRERTIQALEKERAAGSLPSTSTSTLRSNEKFILRQRCIFCFKDAVIDRKKKNYSRNPVSMVTTLEFRSQILNVAKERGDEWGTKVAERISHVVDLVAADAVYHRMCHKKFLRKPTKLSHSGRPKDEAITSAMQQIFKYLEENTEECQYSLSHLMNQISGYRPNAKTVIANLRSKYGDDIFISTRKKRNTIICFRNIGHKILSTEWYSNQQSDEQSERRRIVETAADLILSEIRSTVYDTENYPSTSHFLQNVDDQVPELLDLLLQRVICYGKKSVLKWKKKCTTIGHSIIAATRPRSFISPILLGNSIYLHSKFESKEVVELFSKQGFCAPYQLERSYTQSAIVNHQERIRDHTSTQFVFDNADFNSATLDGHKTLHLMGGIQCLSPASGVLPSTPVRKLKRNLTEEEIAGLGNVPIAQFVGPAGGLRNIELLNLNELMPQFERDSELPSLVDTLWFYGRISGAPLGGWHGFTKSLHKEIKTEKTYISYLPFIDLPPTNLDCIYTALKIAQEKTRALSQMITFVTFDQPLYIKAVDMVESLGLENVIVRLGGFHLLMSFLGAIGHLMAGSGLRELLALIYAPNSLEKLLSGHSYSRAIRAHFLVQEALAKIMFHDLTLTEDDFNEIQLLLEEPTLTKIKHSMPLRRIFGEMQNMLLKYTSRGPTAQLWCQYFSMVTIVKRFIDAERSGDWLLHLTCVRNMIPFFHAVGHIHYAKSAHLYLQKMLTLPDIMPATEFQKFTTDFFTIRRSHQFWNGVWTDQTIEQTLMRNMKKVGGIVHGRSTTKSVQSQWILGLPITSQVCEHLENFTGVKRISSEQHHDTYSSRIARDKQDVNKLINYFTSNSPFIEYNYLVSISTGLIGSTANCHDAYECGRRTMESIFGKKYSEVILRKKDNVITLSSNSILVNKVAKVIEPLALFQRMTILNTTTRKLRDYFCYELAPYPLSLFQEGGVMRKATKSELYDMLREVEYIEKKTDYYVIDGGFLLHRVVWPPNQNFESLCECYLKYIQNHYGDNVHIIFDGYAVTSLKDSEHARRYERRSPQVKFHKETPVMYGQKLFLANETNKKAFINMLAEYLERRGLEISFAVDDADSIIINMAIHKSEIKPNVVVVGEDTDLIVLLIGLSSSRKEIIFIKPGKGGARNQYYSSCQSVDRRYKSIILFIHAFSGCDSTSAMYGKGKTSVYKLLKKNCSLIKAAKPFNVPYSTEREIKAGGTKLLLALYGAPSDVTSLNEWRYIKYQRGASSNKKVDLRALCPTDDAAMQHFKRVYAQLQLWRGMSINFEEWGWHIREKKAVPISMQRPPAPPILLKNIFCRCTKGCSKRCTCRSIGLKCSPTCTCASTCLNAMENDSAEDDSN